MRAFVVAPEAEEDLFQIWSYLLLKAGRETADRIEDELLDAIKGIAETPGKGHKRSDLTGSKVLFYTLYQYMVIYRVSESVDILAVLHGKRNVKRILRNRL